MATISENLQTLNQAKQSIKTAIEEKGVSLENTPFTEYGTKIAEIQVGGGSDRVQELAKSIIERTIIEVLPSDIDALGLTKVGWQSFARCSQLKRFISTKEQNITTNNATFESCGALLEAHIGYLLGSSTFSGCSKLQKVKIFSNANFAWGVFLNCKALKVVDLRNATFVPSIDATAQIFQGVPSGCQIVVPDNLYDAWSTATNWVAYDNLVFVKASEYTEYVVVE